MSNLKNSTNSVEIKNNTVSFLIDDATWVIGVLTKNGFSNCIKFINSKEQDIIDAFMETKKII